MTRPVKLTVWGAACALVPFVFFVGATSYQVTNGVLTDYSYLNVAAIVGGIAAACLGFALLSHGPSAMAESTRPGWAVPVCVVLVLLGALQVVRGAGRAARDHRLRLRVGIRGLLRRTALITAPPNQKRRVSSSSISPPRSIQVGVWVVRVFRY